MDEGKAKVVVSANWDDVPHLSEQDKQRLQLHKVDVCEKGASLGNGWVFSATEKSVAVKRFNIASSRQDVDTARAFQAASRGQSAYGAVSATNRASLTDFYNRQLASSRLQASQAAGMNQLFASNLAQRSGGGLFGGIAGTAVGGPVGGVIGATLGGIFG